MNVCDILFNTIQPKIWVINFLCLVTKQYIYRQRCTGGELNFPQLKQIVLGIINVEKYIAIKNNRLIQHERMWMPNLKNPQQFGQSVEQYVQEYVSNI